MKPKEKLSILTIGYLPVVFYIAAVLARAVQPIPDSIRQHLVAALNFELSQYIANVRRDSMLRTVHHLANVLIGLGRVFYQESKNICFFRC